MRVYRRPPKATIVSGLLLVVFYVVLFFAVPDHLPTMIQRLVGVTNGLLAMLVVKFAIDELAKKHKTFKFLNWRRVSTGQTAGLAVFALVMGWWLTPWAPIKVGAPAVDEIAGWLSDEIAAVVLVTPNQNLATIDFPTPPPQAAAAASRIPLNAGSYSLAIKALAERRFGDADQLIGEVAESQEMPADKVLLVRGQIELYAGRLETATKYLQQALDLRPDDFDLLKQATAAWAIAGDLDRAAALARRALSRASSERPTDRPVALNLLTAITVCQGDLIAANSFSQQAQSGWEKMSSTGSPDIDGPMAASRNNQAVLYATQPNKYTGAESQLRGALDLWTQAYGPEHPHVAASLTCLGMLYYVQGRFAEAEEAYARALAIERSSLPSKHPSTLVTQIAYAELINTLARFDEAKRLADDATSSLDRQLINQLFAALRTQGQIASSRGKYTDAAVNYHKALELTKKRIPDDHPFVASVLEGLAEVDILRGQYKETEEVARKALDIFLEKLGDNHPQTARALDTDGFVLLHGERRADAQRQFERAMAILQDIEQELGRSLPEAARNLSGLAALQPKSRWRDAITECRKALAIDVKLFGAAGSNSGGEAVANIPSTARYLHQMARLYARNGTTPEDRKQAAQLYQQSLDICESRLPDIHPQTAAVLEDYAALLRKMGEKQKAAALAKRAEQIRESQPKDQS